MSKDHEIVGLFAAGVVAVGTVAFVAKHPGLMGEWALWVGWQLRFVLLTILVLLTLWLLVWHRRRRKAVPAEVVAAVAQAATGPRVDETTEPPVQRVEHYHFHVDAGRTAHPYSCPCRGKAEVECAEPGDHATHAACNDAGRRPCPFPADLQEV